MEIRSLEKFGLTKGESKVYLALLKIGKSTIGNIIKEARVSNSKIYDILDRLNKKGLIGIVIENNRKSFEAKSPEMLKEDLQEQEEDIKNKKEEFDELLPELKTIYETHDVKQEAEVLQGLRGIKSFDEEMLNKSLKGDTIYILGSSKEAGESLEAYFLDWQKRRIKKGVKIKALYTRDALEFAKKREKMKLTEIRILPPKITTPVAIDIAGDMVGTFVFGKGPFCFSIKNQKVADNYRNYFELLWAISKPQHVPNLSNKFKSKN
jgi:HTH-type transcriptional regulator, sugar sensing transcriptional regulator